MNFNMPLSAISIHWSSTDHKNKWLRDLLSNEFYYMTLEILSKSSPRGKQK